MKALIIILSALFSLISLQTENYYIIKVKGDIFDETIGRNLKQGDAVKSTDKLIFKQQDAMAVVISDSRGRFTLKYPAEQNEYNDALYVFVKTALVMSKQRQLSTRAIGISSTVSNLNNYFGYELFNIIGDTLLINLSEKYYPLNKGYDIMVVYEQNGKTYKKILERNNQTIMLSRKTFGLPAEGEVYTGKISFYKINHNDGINTLLSETSFRFIDWNQLEKELNIIIEKFYNGNKPELQSLLKDYFKDFYGKTDEIVLTKFTGKLIDKHVQE